MATDFSKLKVVDLKAELKRLGLAQNGLKAELVARLEDATAAEGVDPESSETAAEEPTDTPGADVQPMEADVGDAELTGAKPIIEPVVEPTAPVEPTVTPVEPVVELVVEAVVESVVEPIGETVQEKEATPIAEESREIQETDNGAIAALVDVSSDATPLPPTEVIEESQKRKRRSLSPPPSPDVSARKRPRHDGNSEGEEVSIVESLQETAEELEPSYGGNLPPTDIEMKDVQVDEILEHRGHDRIVEATATTHDDMVEDLQSTNITGTNSTPHLDKEAHIDTPSHLDQPDSNETSTDLGPQVEPSIHPATSALYIKNFMRPLRPQAVKEHLLSLATPANTPFNEGSIVNFYLDSIRTHAFVVFSDVSTASRVRASLHEQVWPDETNRKALWVDFMPASYFDHWVDREQASSGGRGALNRFEVIYENEYDGNVTARLEESGASVFSTQTAPPAPPLPTGPLAERRPSIPTGPRYPGIENAPLGPRNPLAGRGPAVHPSRMERIEQAPNLVTRAYPSVSYQPVSDELVRRRLDAISAAKAKDVGQDFGKEYKRYFFERGDILVDRGPEIFLGIRPPHRERERRRGLRGEGRSGSGGGGGGGNGRGGGRGPPGGNAGGGRNRRHRRPMPRYHGVPKGGDRFRPGSSSGPAFDDRSSRYGGSRGGSRRDSYDRY